MRDLIERNSIDIEEEVEMNYAETVNMEIGEDVKIIEYLKVVDSSFSSKPAPSQPAGSR